MKKIGLFKGLMVTLLIVLSGCGSPDTTDTDTYYVEVDVELVEKSKCGDTKTMLIRLEDKDFMYREITNNDLVDDEMYYSYEVGDIMHFEYLVKDAFFGIDPEEDEYKEEF